MLQRLLISLVVIALLGDSARAQQLDSTAMERAARRRAAAAARREAEHLRRRVDFVRISAAVPHTFIVSGKEPMEYLVIKQRRQDLPIRWASEK